MQIIGATNTGLLRPSVLQGGQIPSSCKTGLVQRIQREIDCPITVPAGPRKAPASTLCEVSKP